MRAWKKRAMALGDRILELDPDGAGLSLPQLRKATGESRAVLEWALGWLVEIGAATMTLDAEKRRRWSAVADEPEVAQPLVHDPSLAEIVSSLALDVDILAELLS